MVSSRLVLLSSLCAVSTAAAQPKPDPKPAPPADPGTTVVMPDDAPPKDIEGRDENPDNPGEVRDPATKVVIQPKAARTGYPVEEALRPITLPKNMTEVSIGPHLQVSPFQATDALRARFGITSKVQLGLTYVTGSFFDDNDVDPAAGEKIAFHGGKAVGLDLTVMLDSWIGVRLGVPVYIKPVALSLALGTPVKFTFGDKFAIGGLDDLLNIKLYRFAPSFYQESVNVLGEVRDDTGTAQSAGQFRLSTFGIYQRDPKTALIGKFGFNIEDFTVNKSNENTVGGGLTYFIRVGIQYSPRKFLDVGASIGFDDLAENGSFGPAGYLALRI